MSEKKYTWHKIADSADELIFDENNLLPVEAGGKKICMARNKGLLYACAQKCPHAGGILADGFIDALGNIVCPVHRYRFNLQNGRNSSGEGYYLKTFPVSVNEKGVFIGLEDAGFFNWLK